MVGHGACAGQDISAGRACIGHDFWLFLNMLLRYGLIAIKGVLRRLFCMGG
jgi:hypothetical protein